MPLEFTQVTGRIDAQGFCFMAEVNETVAAGLAAHYEYVAAHRFTIFVRCAGHAYHHVGQIVYLSRELART